jgi:hypothetical protein
MTLRNKSTEDIRTPTYKCLTTEVSRTQAALHPRPLYTDGAWGWTLTSIKHRRLEYVELCLSYKVVFGHEDLFLSLPEGIHKQINFYSEIMNHATYQCVSDAQLRTSTKEAILYQQINQNTGQKVYLFRVHIWYCTTRNFIVCTIRQILLGWSNEGGWDGRGMQPAWGKLKIRIKFSLTTWRE